MVFAVSAPRRWLQINHRKDHRGGRSSGRRGGVLPVVATGINAVQHQQEQVRAASGLREVGSNFILKATLIFKVPELPPCLNAGRFLLPAVDHIYFKLYNNTRLARGKSRFKI